MAAAYCSDTHLLPGCRYTPKLLDYACHVLNDQPRLSEQILMCQDHTRSFRSNLPLLVISGVGFERLLVVSRPDA